MLHIDVRNDRNTQDLHVEVSTDGGPWHPLAVFAYTVGDNFEENSYRALSFARAWRDGARFAGAEVRGTALGYTL